MMSLGDVAAKLGLPVFPCGANKRPVVETGFKAATSDAAEITALFGRPGAELIGMPTGRASGLIAIDIDIRPGHTGMDWLDENRYALPETRTHKTRSGGLHLIFRAPEGVEIRNSASRLAPGVDVRGEGGYIILPPSPGYAVADESEPAEMPRWLIRACMPPEPQPAPAPAPRPATRHGGTPYGLAALDNLCHEVTRAPFGRQEPTLNEAGLKIGALIAGGELEEGTAVAELLAAARFIASEPGREPWTPAEIEKKLRRAVHDGKARPRQAPPRVAPWESQSAPPPLDDPGYWDAVDTAHAEDGEPVVEPDAEPEPAKNIGLRVLHLPSLHLRPVPERRWIVPNWLPVKQVTLNYADGGVGKTLLAMQLMAATALSKPWCGLQVEPCASVGLFSEDDETELHIRMEAIRRSYGVDFTSMADAHPIDATGQDNIFAHFDGNRMLPTERFTVFREYVLDTKARLAVIDTAATTFGGNENDRSQVTQFVGSLLTSLAQEMDGAVLLNAHPSVTGIANGDLRSGSTGWNNSARSRWAMTRPEGEDGKPQLDSSERILTRRKSNAAAAGETLTMTWENGVFMPKQAPDTMGAGNRKDAAERAFLNALRASPRPASSEIRASNYAPRMFHLTPHGADFSLPELAEAMRNLLSRGVLVVAEYQQDYKTKFGLREAH